MPNPNIRLRIGGKRSPFDKDALILFKKWDSLGVSAPSADKPYISRAISYLKSKGVWNELDALFVFDVHARGAALVDWKNPNSRTASTVGDYAGDFTAYSGFLGNNASFAIQTNFNPGDGGTYKYTQNSACKGLFVNSNDTTASKIDMSAETALAAGINVFLNNTGNPTTYSASNNANDIISFKTFQRRGWHITKRTGAASYNFYKNGQTYNRTAKTTASTAVPNLNINILRRNMNGVFSAYSPRRIPGAFFGSGNFEPAHLINGVKIWNQHSGILATKALIIDGNSFTAAGTYVDTIYGNYIASNTVTDFTQGLAGIRMTEMVTNFPTSIGLIDLSGYAKKVLFVWELTNEMYEGGNNVTATYNSLVNYCNLARATHGSDLKIVVATCMPRGGSNPITPALRQNPLNLNDTSTLNGLIRTNYASFCDAIADTASDPTMGIDSGGVAGVGEKNTTYYGGDEIHPTTAGYQLLANTYIYPAINALM